MHRSLTQTLLASALTLSLSGPAIAQAVDWAHWESARQELFDGSVQEFKVSDDDTTTVVDDNFEVTMSASATGSLDHRGFGGQMLNPAGFTLGTAVPKDDTTGQAAVRPYALEQIIHSGVINNAEVDADFTFNNSTTTPVANASTDRGNSDNPLIVSDQNYLANAVGNTITINRNVTYADVTRAATDADNVHNVEVSSNQTIDAAAAGSTATGITATTTFKGFFRAQAVINNDGSDTDLTDDFTEAGETTINVTAQARGNAYLMDMPGGGLNAAGDALLTGGKIEIDNIASHANVVSATTTADFTNFVSTVPASADATSTVDAAVTGDQVERVSATAQSIGNTFATGKSTAAQKPDTDGSGNDIAGQFTEHADYLNTAYSSNDSGSRINITQSTAAGFDADANLQAAVGGVVGDGTAPDVRLTARAYGNNISLGYNGNASFTNAGGGSVPYGDAERVAGNLNVTSDQEYVGDTKSTFTVASKDFNNNYDSSVAGAVDNYSYSNVAAGNNLSFDPAFDHGGTNTYNVTGNPSFTQRFHAVAGATSNVVVDTAVNTGVLPTDTTTGIEAAAGMTADGTVVDAGAGQIHNVATFAYGSRVIYTARATTTATATDPGILNPSMDATITQTSAGGGTTAIPGTTVTPDTAHTAAAGTLNVLANHTSNLGQMVDDYTAASTAVFNSATVNAGTATTTSVNGALVTSYNNDFVDGSLSATQTAVSAATGQINVTAKTHVLHAQVLNATSGNLENVALQGSTTNDSRLVITANAIANEMTHMVPRAQLNPAAASTYTAHVSQISNARVTAEVRNTLQQVGGRLIISGSATGNAFRSIR